MFRIVSDLLTKSGFSVGEVRVSTEQRDEPAAPEIPQAAAYIVDCHARPGSAASVVERILARYPAAAICVVGEKLGQSEAFPLMQLRVRGFVTYADAPSQLARAVEALIAGGLWISRTLLTRFLEEAVAADSRYRARRLRGELTQREHEVLDCLIDNLSNKEIAKKLGISERGVKFHVSNLLDKHKVQRRSDLILMFLTDTRPRD